jgi:hypothetical protein
MMAAIVDARKAVEPVSLTVVWAEAEPATAKASKPAARSLSDFIFTTGFAL